MGALVAAIGKVAGRTDHNGWSTLLLRVNASGPVEIVRR
jgi:hypothetical protein